MEDAMALQIEDRVDDTMDRVRFRAKDSATGKSVAVTISHEAFKDHGEAACLDKAQGKYNRSAGSVDVTTGDF
jgi:hypothetical protein